LMTLHAAWVIDQQGAPAARSEIALIKFFGARVLHDVIDRTLQLHGSLGYSSDMPLEEMYRHARAARLYDGPDEVHRQSVARLCGWGADRQEPSKFAARLALPDRCRGRLFGFHRLRGGGRVVRDQRSPRALPESLLLARDLRPDRRLPDPAGHLDRALSAGLPADLLLLPQGLLPRLSLASPLVRGGGTTPWN